MIALPITIHIREKGGKIKITVDRKSAILYHTEEQNKQNKYLITMKSNKTYLPLSQ